MPYRERRDLGSPLHFLVFITHFMKLLREQLCYNGCAFAKQILHYSKRQLSVGKVVSPLYW